MTRASLLHGLMMVLLLVAAGCSRKITSSATTEVTDSVHVREVPRFIEVKIPGDTVEILRIIECDSITNKPKPFQERKRSGRASMKIEVSTNGELKATGACDSLNKVIQAMDREIYKSRHERKTEIITHTVYEIRGAAKVFMWIGVATVIAAVMLFFYVLNKYF